MPTTSTYALGTGLDELERLGLQHRLWSDAAHAAWRRAGVRLGDRVLDVGAGPGYASFDLAQLVGPSGRVVAVDESRAFVDRIAEQARARHLENLIGVMGDAQALAKLGDVAEGTFQLAYARWVLCFVAAPEAVVAGVARALAPGGTFVVHDYFNYATMTSAPRRASITKVVEATMRSWRDRGGDPDVAGRLPAMMESTGLEVLSIDVQQRVARPMDSMFSWPDTWWRTYAPKLLETGYITDTDLRQLLEDLDALAASRTDFWVCPPMYEIVGRKR
jgi:ubiquinone/menaquinone biosynthesis C-methylase UbiE